MDFSLESVKEPSVYYRNNSRCYFDPVSRKLRIKTPEENVRQNVIEFLHTKMMVPYTAMCIELPMSSFENGARGRVDIAVFGIDNAREYNTVLVIECKAPQVFLTDRVFDQVDRYAAIARSPFVAVTNGITFILDFWDTDAREYRQVTKLPTYEELCKPRRLEMCRYEKHKYIRTGFSDLNRDTTYRKYRADGIVGVDTPRSIIPFAVNLYDCFQDDDILCTRLDLKGADFVSDCGVRYTEFGNASGGSYPGFYRCFMIKDETGNNQLVSMGVFGTEKTTDDEKYGTRRGITCLVVAIDDFLVHHNSLQLSLDDCTHTTKDQYQVSHDGRLTVGNLGAAKRSAVISYISASCNDMIRESRIELGALPNDKLLQFEMPEVQCFVANLIRYALARDKYRDFRKSHC